MVVGAGECATGGANVEDCCPFFVTHIMPYTRMPGTLAYVGWSWLIGPSAQHKREGARRALADLERARAVYSWNENQWFRGHGRFLNAGIPAPMPTSWSSVRNGNRLDTDARVCRARPRAGRQTARKTSLPDSVLTSSIGRRGYESMGNRKCQSTVDFVASRFGRGATSAFKN